MSLQSLTASSTPQQIAAAYKDYSTVAGNNVAVQDAARTMLLNKGIAAPTINQAFSFFSNPVALQPVAPPVVAPIAAPVAQKVVTPAVKTTSAPVAMSQPATVAPKAAAVTAPASTAPATGGVSDAFILSWLAKNPNPTASQISALSQFGVTPDRVKALSGAAPAPVAAPVAPTVVTPTASNPFPGMTVEDLYRMHAGKEPDAEGLAFWKNAFGPEIDEAERAQFIKSVLEVQNKPAAVAAPPSAATAPAVTPTDPLAALYQSVLGRTPSQQELDSWGFGSEVDAQELDRFLGAARSEVAQTKPTEGVTGQLAKQILAQGTTGKWGGEGYGTAEQNAYDMAALLAAQGITDINQFGVRDKQVTTEARYDEQGGIDQPEGTYTTKEYYNKSTGQPLNSYYDKAKGNIWGGTFEGEGSTSYGVQFQPDGTPIFYSQYGGSSNDVANVMSDLGVAGQIALAVATGGLSIPQQIAAQAALGLASGKDVGDIAKGALASFAMAGISDVAAIKDGAKYLNSVDPSGVLSGAFQGAVMSGAKAGLTGQSIGDAVMSGAIAGGTSGAVNAALDLPEFQGLSSAQKKLAANAIGGALSGKPLDQVLINTAIAAGRAAIKGTQTPAPVVDMKPTSYGTNITKDLADSGMEEVDLPTGIQTASSDGDGPFRVESSGSPIYADSPRADAVRPPPGYRLMATTEEQAVEDGDRTRYVKPSGAYYDYTANAWFVPSGEFDLSGVEDYSDLFKGENQNLTDEDLAFIQGNDFGSGEQTDFDYADFLNSIGITNTSDLGPSPSNQEILDSIGYVPPSDTSTVNVVGKKPEPDLGTVNVTGQRPEPDFGTMEVIGKRPEPEPDFGTIEVVGKKPEPDLGTIEVIGKRPEPEPDLGTIDVVAPRPEPVVPPVTPPPVVKPPVVTPPAVTPPKVTPQQVAQILGVPVSSPIVQDMIEALYGTMEYLDIDAAFSPAATRAQDQASTKQAQQTKMAEGGYLDNLLAENMSVDELLNLLR